MDALVPTNCQVVCRERIIHVTQRNTRAHPELAQLTAVRLLFAEQHGPTSSTLQLIPVLGNKLHFV